MPTASLGSSGTHAWPHSTYSMDEELSTSFVLALDLEGLEALLLGGIP